MRYRDNPLIEQRYNCERWKKVRKLKRLTVHGLCEKCMEKGLYIPGKIVHHIEPITDCSANISLGKVLTAITFTPYFVKFTLNIAITSL